MVPQVRGDSFVIDDNRIVKGRKSSSHANLRIDDHTQFWTNSFEKNFETFRNRDWLRHRPRRDGDTLEIKS